MTYIEIIIIMALVQWKKIMKAKETLIISAGSNAQSIVDIIYQQNNHINYLYLDYEKQVINTNNSKTIWFNNLKFLKTKYDVKDYEEVLLSRTSKFKEIISNFKNILIISCIGENYSSNTLFSLIEYFEKNNINHSIFIIKPSSFNGRKQNEQAIKALDKLDNIQYSLGKDLFIFDCNDIINKEPKSISEAISISNKKASEAIKLILET